MKLYINQLDIRTNPLNKKDYTSTSISASSKMAYCLVTPASRGIGHALTKHLLTTTKVPVVATTRKDSDGVKSSILEKLKDVESSRLTVLELDVTGTVPVFYVLCYALPSHPATP